MTTQAQEQAFDYAFENSHDNEAAIWQSLRYLLKLHELDPGAVTVQFPPETGEDFIRFIFTGVDVVDDSDKLNDFPEVFELQRWTAQGLNHIRHKNIVLYDEDDLTAYMGEVGHHPGMQRVGRYGQRVKRSTVD